MLNGIYPKYINDDFISLVKIIVFNLYKINRIFL